MIRSFRLRIALLASTLAALALGAFGVAAWLLIRDLRLDDIDGEIRAHAERETARERPADEWRRIETGIAAGLGTSPAQGFALRVQDAAGEDRYAPAHWPVGLDPARLRWPASPAASPARDRPPRPAPGTDGRDGPAPTAGGERPATRIYAVAADGRHWRLALAASDRARIAIAIDQAAVDAEMAAIRNAFALALLPVLLAVGSGAWVFSARALRPLRRLTETARQVNAEGLDRRLPLGREDREFDALIAVFNDMLARLERSFGQARRFSADAAHELKTPLAILQGQLERAIQDAEPGSEMQQRLSGFLDEVRRLSSISARLMLLARADAGRLSVQRQRLDLAEVLDELAEDTRMLAPQLRLDLAIAKPLAIDADPTLLRQVLHNLVSNAIKFNLDGGWIRIEAGMSAAFARVTVANASAGIPAADRERIFERFFRGDPSRTREVEGVGLGLSVAREIARAHGGELRLQPEKPGEVAFVLTLPAGIAPAAPGAPDTPR